MQVVSDALKRPVLGKAGVIGVWSGRLKPQPKASGQPTEKTVIRAAGVRKSHRSARGDRKDQTLLLRCLSLSERP